MLSQAVLYKRQIEMNIEDCDLNELIGLGRDLAESTENEHIDGAVDDLSSGFYSNAAHGFYMQIDVLGADGLDKESQVCDQLYRASRALHQIE